jgi:hypothetical protein
MLLVVVGCSKEEARRELPPLTEPEPAAFQPTPGPDANWWCVASPNEVVTCDRLRNVCDERRRTAVKYYPSHVDEPCKPLAKAVCVTRKSKLDETTQTACYPSFTICNNMRDNLMRGQEADWTVAVNCEASD